MQVIVLNVIGVFLEVRACTAGAHWTAQRSAPCDAGAVPRDVANYVDYLCLVSVLCTAAGAALAISSAC